MRKPARRRLVAQTARSKYESLEMRLVTVNNAFKIVAQRKWRNMIGRIGFHIIQFGDMLRNSNLQGVAHSSQDFCFIIEFSKA